MNNRAIVLGFIVMSAFASALAAGTVSNVTASQRYPWNGMVDLAFTITGDAGIKYNTSFVAKDVVGGTNLTMKTIYKSDGSSAALTNVLDAGSYKWVWDAAADLPIEFNCERVSVDVNAQNVLDINTATYMVVNLTSGAKEYLDAPPSSGWTADPYLYTKMVFRRVPAQSFTQSTRTVNVSKMYYIALYPITLGQLSKISGWKITGDGVTGKDSWYNWYYNGSSNPSPTNPYTQYVFDYSNSYHLQEAHRVLRDSYNNGYNNVLTKNWPSDSHNVVSTSPVGKFRSKTGLSLTDMPTEAQLELAKKYIGSIGTMPNSCLDWYGTLGSTTVTDPVGPSSGSYRVGLSYDARCSLYSGGSHPNAVVRLCVNL